MTANNDALEEQAGKAFKDAILAGAALRRALEREYTGYAFARERKKRIAELREERRSLRVSLANQNHLGENPDPAYLALARCEGKLIGLGYMSLNRTPRSFNTLPVTTPPKDGWIVDGFGPCRVQYKPYGDGQHALIRRYRMGADYVRGVTYGKQHSMERRKIFKTPLEALIDFRGELERERGELEHRLAEVDDYIEAARKGEQFDQSA